jgi:hypothetical protein
MWHCANGPVVPDVHKDRSAIAFRVEESARISRPWRRKHDTLKMLVITQHDISTAPLTAPLTTPLTAPLTAPLTEPQFLQHLFVITTELEAKENVHVTAMLHYMPTELACYIICSYSWHVTLYVHTAGMLHYMFIQLACYIICSYSCHVTLYVHTAGM